jgi:hypothetical protein
MSPKGLQKLVIRLNASEIELLRRAGLVEAGHTEQLAVWAKETLLKSARSLAEGPEGQSRAAAKASPSRPKCSCGATANANGQCDGSCIMRF